MSDTPAPETPDVPEVEIVARVTRAFHCANRIEAGQDYVFGLDGRIDAARSSAPLCLGILAKLQPALLAAQDRVAEGLPALGPIARIFDCYDTGIDHGGTGKVYVELSVRPRGGAVAAPGAAAPSSERTRS